MSLWLRRRDLRTLLYIAIVIKFLATFEYIFIIFLLIFLLAFIVVTINPIQLLAAILIRINYLSIYLSNYSDLKDPPATRCRQVTDMLPTHRQLSADCRLTVG